MSGEPRKVWTKAVPQLLGIAALAALFLAGVRSERAPEKSSSKLQQASGRLRVGMTQPEAFAATEFANDLLTIAFAGTSHSHIASFFDPRRREFLTLRFVTKHNPLIGRYESLLVDWSVSKP